MDPKLDSILTAKDSTSIDTTLYYKLGKGLPDQTVAMAERPYSVATDNYILGGIMLFAFIIAVLLYRGRTLIVFRIKEFFSSKRTYSEENVNENDREVYSTFLLTSISAFSISLLVFDYIGMKVGFERAWGIPYWLFAAGYVAMVGFIYLKAWLYALINWTFFDKESCDKWMEGYLLLTSLLAFPIFPLSLIAILIESSREIVMWCLAFVFILYELLLFFKMFVNFGGKIYGYVLLFLYFCSLEIVPALIMCRLIMWVIGNFIVKILD